MPPSRPVDRYQVGQWDNYEDMLLQEGKSRNVIDEHRLVIDRALDLAGDPKIGPNGLEGPYHG